MLYSELLRCLEVKPYSVMILTLESVDFAENERCIHAHTVYVHCVFGMLQSVRLDKFL